MSQYNKTVLTNAGLELAKRANAGQAKFEITRAVTSADDWSNKTIQDLEEATAIPNIMQQGTIMDAEEVESNNSVIGVSLCFTNKDLSTSYQIRVIGLYVKEEGQDKDFLYAVTTAVSPEYMPGFGDKVLYRFNMQMYLVIGKAQAVNVVINEGTAVTHGQFDKYKGEVSEDLKRIEENHKEDMSHVVKSASVNGGAEILPDGSGKLNLIVPDPDLSKYVSLEQLGELLKAKADITAVPDKTDTEEGIKQAKAAAKAADDKAQSALVQLPNKADTSTVNVQIADAKNTIKSNVDNLQSAINTKANASDVYTKKQLDDAFSNRDNSISNLINRVKQIDGETIIGNAVDVNTLEGTPNQVTVYKLPNVSNTNTPSWIGDHRGVMIVLNYDGNAKTQIWTPVGVGALNKDGSFGWRYWEGENPTDWNRLASVSYVDNLHNDLQIQTNNLSETVNSNFTSLTGRIDSLNKEKDQLNTKVDQLTQDKNNLSAEVNNLKSVEGKVNVDTPLFHRVLNNDTWVNITGTTNDNKKVLTALRDDGPTGDGPTAGGNGSGIAFGGGDTKGVLSLDWRHPIARIAGGNADKPVWHEDIAWKSDIDRLQSIINQQNQTIQSLTSRLTNAENEINYIKANYIEGKRFPASQEAQAEAWENEKPTRLAMIEK
ncbi:hypothetical protein IMAU10142_01163 [Lactobacillus helveticus]|uniref:hypothetical protein n=1 Tax=Lactobacillus helveticus TaxID=1587 RepID=UPI0015672C33|nr:hypothetical protein [Lactobacillus helveticus]NRO91135.1 hypothetical protein [Lactobacillus helveticus]